MLACLAKTIHKSHQKLVLATNIQELSEMQINVYKPADICFIQANIRDMTSWKIARKPLTRIDDVTTILDRKKNL